MTLNILKEQAREKADPIMILENLGVGSMRIDNSEIRCPCPIHKGSGFNFSFDLEKGVFSCFSRHCGEEVGLPRDIFLLVMLVKNLSFPHAVRYIAGLCGLNGDGLQYTKEDDDAYKLRQWLRRQKRLERDDIPSLDESIMEEFSCEYPPYLLGRYKDTNILKQFEVKYASKGHFKNRIIVPIRDEESRLVGLSGRLATDNKEELKRYKKYMHMANFSSGVVLYGLNKAKDFIVRDGFMILTEGFFDVISSFQRGVNNICAVMGSTILPEQIDLVIKYTSTVYLAFDGDLAGRAASWKVYERLRHYCDVRFIDIPNGEDVDSLSTEQYWDLCLSPMKAVEFKKKYNKELKEY